MSIDKELENSFENVEDIINYLKKCDDAYFNSGTPLVPDSVYDSLKEAARNMVGDSHPYFSAVGSRVRGGKIKLPYKMGSLNQIHTGDLQQWVQKYNLSDKDIVITDKLDGVSCMLIYQNGKFSAAYSRGDGLFGADITRHILRKKEVDITIKNSNHLAIRCELIMKNDTFKQKYSEMFKNPRNMVSGIINRKESDENILSDIDIVCYELVAGDIRGLDVSGVSKADSLNILAETGFKVVKSEIHKCKELDENVLKSMLSMRRVQSEYELDGLVLTVDDFYNVENISQSSSINPEHSVKFKVLEDDSILDAIVKDVHWEISKSGYIKPRVEIYPVDIFGTTVKYATGFNAKYIIDNGIGKGAKIKITKSGMVIPYIVEVVKKVEPALPPDNLGEWEFTESGVDAVLVNKEENREVIFKQVLDFFETLKVDLFKEATLKTLMDEYIASKTYDDIIFEICDLSETEFYNIIGVNGSKIYRSLHYRLENCKPEVFFGACKHLGVGFGVRKAKNLIKNLKDVPNDLLKLTENDIVSIDGFDTKTAQMVLSGINDAVKLCNRLIDSGLLKFKIDENASNSMGNVNVVMTGFRDKELQDYIESNGGKVSQGVSSKTTHLLCVDINSNSAKMKKAKELNIKIMTPEEFKAIYNI